MSSGGGGLLVRQFVIESPVIGLDKTRNDRDNIGYLYDHDEIRWSEVKRSLPDYRERLFSL